MKGMHKKMTNHTDGNAPKATNYNKGAKPLGKPVRMVAGRDEGNAVPGLGPRRK